MPRSIHELTASIRCRGLTAVRRLQTLPRDCRGASLMETVIAVMVFALVGTAVLSGVSTAHTSGATTERQSTAENIARNQMEYAFSLPYQNWPSSYPTIGVPQGYAVTCQAEEYVLGDLNIEKVIVTVTFDSTQQLVLETLRTK